MTMQFRCDSCGTVQDVAQWGALGSTDVSNSGSVPEGWRTLYVTIEEHLDDEGGSSSSTGELLHSCAACNQGATPDEQHEDAVQALRAMIARRRSRLAASA